MGGAVSVFVSKRLQKAAVAILCLVTAHMVLAAASCHPENLPMGAAARVSIGR